MAEQITERWQELFSFQPEAPHAVMLAAALDPRFSKLKFLPAEEVFKVQNMIQSFALALKKEARQSSGRGNEATTTLVEHSATKDG